MLVRRGTMVSIANFCLRYPMRSPSIKPRSTISTLMNPLCTARTTSSTSSYKDGAFMPPAGNHAGGHDEKEVQFAVDVDQTHQFVAAVLLIALVAEIDLFGFHRVVVFVEPKQVRFLVVLVICLLYTS